MLNPITYTEKTIGDFLRYQVTTYPFADDRLYDQMRALLNLERTRHTPLLQGPFITLSKSFRPGAAVGQLVAEGVLHPHLANLSPYPTLFGHQEQAMRAIAAGRSTLVSTGTGSGKTEAFLYPIISHCLRLRDQHAPPGIAAVIVYPMNALAEDQLERLRGLLAGTGLTFGMYIGKTPESEDGVHGVRLPPGSSKADYLAKLDEVRRQGQRQAVYPAEEVASRAALRDRPPRILLTNVKQLELLLTRQRDAALFAGARLDFLVFDEAHTYSGAAGAETAVLIRRLRAFCGRQADETVCIATSATIVDAERGPEAGRDFAARFFGVDGAHVELVGEQYEPDQWADARTLPPPLVGDSAVHLANVLAMVDAATDAGNQQAAAVLRALLGARFTAAAWREELFDALSRNELVYQLAGALLRPQAWATLLPLLARRVGRSVGEEELLIWLALGAAARRGDRPFLRPVVHAFVRGISGAVVTFPEGQTAPRLWLSAGDAAGHDGDYRLNVLSCSTCGQHYFEHHVQDFTYTERDPQGGNLASDGTQFWQPLEQTLGGNRLLLLDQLIGSTDEDDETEEEAASPLAQRGRQLWLCRGCGALHAAPTDLCAHCGTAHSLLPLWALQQKEGLEGSLHRCVSCGSNGRRGAGGRFREPIRPIRATTVSDVHVLAQNMIQHAERKRLLVFSDNRQDAAFQAGWMQDHARRFRLRALMYERIGQGALSVGDLTAWLDHKLEQDDDLSQALAREVWAFRKESEPTTHREQRKNFLRIQVLREVTTGARQRLGLEPWGRMRVDYRGLTADVPLVQQWAAALQLNPQALCDGIAALLDNVRRNSVVLDRDGNIFSQRWQEGAAEVQRGYLPLLPNVPRGVVLTRAPQSDRSRLQQWLSDSGHETLVTQALRAWGVPAAQLPAFVEALWELLTQELRLLVPATLIGWRNQPLRGTAGAFQLDADRFVLAAHRGVYRCQTCRRTQIRPTPHNRCLGWHCHGTLVYSDENPDDYDLMVLDEQFALLRPEEHSAQVPADKRERLERAFKSPASNWVNTLVATPTLEMGVDIGGLDAVLMRNVPPLPSNYWQRAGRAGRRHRMAVNITYARNASHDRAYFEEPLKLLNGTIYPPRINLRNPLMVRKHVHAAVLTVLNQLEQGVALPHAARAEIAHVLDMCFPTYVRDYLFLSDGTVRSAPLDVTPLASVLAAHEAALMAHLQSVFATWPAADAEIVAAEALRAALGDMTAALTEVIARIWRRLQWALRQIAELNTIRKSKATLDAAEDALFNRCDRLVKKLKGIAPRRRSDTEGYDDTYTYGVLAAEGFLPGYGLATGAITGTAQMPLTRRTFMRDFDLPRPAGVALREYAPGNLIYANGNRFVPRFYHLEPDAPLRYQVDLEHGALVELGSGGNPAGLAAQTLDVVVMADVDMPHVSQIGDDEDYRFQMAVTIIGYEQGRHSGGQAFDWGGHTLSLRRSIHLRLVNVGAAQLTAAGQLGYPLSLVSGQSRSPFASDVELDNFRRTQQERYGVPVTNVGFAADVIADALTLQDCANQQVAYSVGEALRMGAANVIDMEVDDLQLLCIGRPGQEQVDLLVYDPMPGGSGLIEQMLERWEEVVEAAHHIVAHCPAHCETVCIDCLMTYRNAYYHRFLDRHVATELLAAWGDQLTFAHDIPPSQPTVTDLDDELPVNAAEQQLLGMIQRAGFPTPLAQHAITLPPPYGQTIPDFYYGEEHQYYYAGICIYLDGLSKHIHGNQRSQQRDAAIREWLHNNEYEVIAIPYSHLADREAMHKHLHTIGRLLVGRAESQARLDSDGWFG